MKGIYVISTSDQRTKVGISCHIDARLRALRTGQDKQAELFSCFGCHPEIHKLEKPVHYKLRDRHIEGEWFSVTPQEATASILETAQFFGLKLRLTHRKTIADCHSLVAANQAAISALISELEPFA